MFKKIMKTIVATTLSASLLAVSILAEDIETIPEGESKTVTSEDTVGTNAGTVDSNSGTIETNTGTVTVNETASTAEATPGTITNNVGTVETNNGAIGANGAEPANETVTLPTDGTVALNNGTITDNYGTVETNGQTGSIENSAGAIDTNNGLVDDNTGIITTNNGVADPADETGDTILENTGVVNKNEGKIETNDEDGLVKDNSGVISTNKGEVQTQTENGVVTENDGTIGTTDGFVATNNGEIDKNTGESVVTTTTDPETGATITELVVPGGVNENKGTITTNQGEVKTNAENAFITTNDSTGTVEVNVGTITTNNGEVKTNNYLITTNNGTIDENKSEFGVVTLNAENGQITLNDGTITTNNGTVSTNTGTIVNNYGDVEAGEGTITNNYGQNDTGDNTVTNQWWKVITNPSEIAPTVSNFLNAIVDGLFGTDTQAAEGTGDGVNVELYAKGDGQIVIAPKEGYAVVGVGFNAANGDAGILTPVYDAEKNVWTISVPKEFDASALQDGTFNLIYATEEIAPIPEGYVETSEDYAPTYVITESGLGKSTDPAGTTAENGEKVAAGTTIYTGTPDHYAPVMLEDPEHPGTYLELEPTVHAQYDPSTNKWIPGVDVTLPAVNGYVWSYDGLVEGNIQFSLAKAEIVKPVKKEKKNDSDAESSGSTQNSGNSNTAVPAAPVVTPGLTASGTPFQIPEPDAKASIIKNTAAMTTEQKIETMVNATPNTLFVSVGANMESVKASPVNAIQLADQLAQAKFSYGDEANVVYSTIFSKPYDAINDGAWGTGVNEIMLKLQDVTVGSTVYLMFTDAAGRIQFIPCVVQKNGTIICSLNGIGDGGILSVVAKPVKARKAYSTRQEVQKEEEEIVEVRGDASDETEDGE